MEEKGTVWGKKMVQWVSKSKKVLIINNNTNNSCVYKNNSCVYNSNTRSFYVRSMKVYSDESMKVKASRRVMETLIKLWWEDVSLNIYIKSLEKFMKTIETVSISSKPTEEKGI